MRCFFGLPVFCLSGFTPVFLSNSPKPSKVGTGIETHRPPGLFGLGREPICHDLAIVFATGKFASWLLKAPGEDSPPLFSAVEAAGACTDKESGSTPTTVVLLWRINTSTLEVFAKKQQQHHKWLCWLRQLHQGGNLKKIKIKSLWGELLLRSFGRFHLAPGHVGRRKGEDSGGMSTDQICHAAFR